MNRRSFFRGLAEAALLGATRGWWGPTLLAKSPPLFAPIEAADLADLYPKTISTLDFYETEFGTVHIDWKKVMDLEEQNDNEALDRLLDEAFYKARVDL